MFVGVSCVRLIGSGSRLWRAACFFVLFVHRRWVAGLLGLTARRLHVRKSCGSCGRMWHLQVFWAFPVPSSTGRPAPWYDSDACGQSLRGMPWAMPRAGLFGVGRLRGLRQRAELG
eukprot:6915863-Alexandrium_andersonii.AAC.1